MYEYISYKEIADKLPINKNDILFVSSDVYLLALKCLENGEKFDCNVFIDTLINKIGENGTLIFPTYNWAFCRGEAFDYRKTPSKTGSLTTAALKRPDFKRTKHPIYSFAVWGKDKELLCSMNNKSSFGKDSPFQYMYDNNAKNLIIGVEYTHSATFVHYVEEKVGTDYRYLKDFKAPYIDNEGNCEEKTYSMYVRDLDKNVIVDVNPMGEIFKQEGIATSKTFNDVEFIVLDMHAACDRTEKDIIYNKSRNITSVLPLSNR